MDILEKLRVQLPDVDDAALTLLYEDAQEIVRGLTRKRDITALDMAVRAVTVLLYNRAGCEGLASYAAGGVSMSYDDLPDAVRHLLPAPLASVGGRRFERVETQPDTSPPGEAAPI